MNDIKELPNKIFLKNPSENPLIFKATKPGEYQINILITGDHRLDLTVYLNDSSSEANIDILYLGEQDRIGEIKVAVIHDVAKSKSRTRIKSVVPSKTMINAEGLIRVERGAIFSEADLRAEALLIGADAKAEFVPSLEILANKVIVSHGATISSFDEEKMFYLKTRGLSEEIAKIALIESFVQPIISDDNKEDINEAINNLFK